MGEAVLAEADPEQRLGDRAQLLEVALVVEAVPQAVEVQRLGADGVDAVAGVLGDQRGGVLADVGVGRAELGEVPVAEGVGGGAVGVLEAEPVVVQEDRPGVQLQPAPPGLRRRLGEGVAVAEGGGRLRAQPLPAPVRRVRLEVGGAGLQVADGVQRVVREDVARLVVDGGEGDAADPGAVGEIAEEVVGALVEQVGGEGENGRLHGYSGRSGAARGAGARRRLRCQGSQLLRHWYRPDGPGGGSAWIRPSPGAGSSPQIQSLRRKVQYRSSERTTISAVEV